MVVKFVISNWMEDNKCLWFFLLNFSVFVILILKIALQLNRHFWTIRCKQIGFVDKFFNRFILLLTKLMRCPQSLLQLFRFHSLWEESGAEWATFKKYLRRKYTLSNNMLKLFTIANHSLSIIVTQSCIKNMFEKL